MGRLASVAWAGLGLTMSEEGGLDEVEESVRAAASCSRNWAISACRASTCACNRWQLAHGLLLAGSIPAILCPCRPPGSRGVNGYRNSLGNRDLHFARFSPTLNRGFSRDFRGW